MTSDDFNLLDEPWIPCLFMGERQVSLLSIRDVLFQADKIDRIVHESPIVSLCLHRLLIAVIYAALRGPDRVSALQELFEDRDSLRSERIDAYLRKAHHHFYLFGKKPFMQDRRLIDELAGDRDQPLHVEKLRRETAAPFEGTLFDHTLPHEQQGLPPAEAARHLLATTYFAIQDGSGYKTSPLTAGVASMALGGSLRETLLLNLLPYNEQQPIKAAHYDRDAPHWEREDPLPSPIPDGWLDYLTRPYRRVLLIREPTGEVSKVYWTSFRRKGADLDDAWRAGVLDPWLAYNVTDRGAAPVQLLPNRALWRDSEALIQQYVDRNRSNPGYARLLARFQREHGVLVWGVRAPNNAIRLWRETRLPIASAYAENPDLKAVLGHGVSVAEEIGTLLIGALSQLAKYALIPNWDELSREEQSKAWREISRRPAPRKKGSKLDEFLRSLQAEPAYWARLDIPFRRFMRDLPRVFADRAGKSAREAWADAVQSAARDAFDRAVDSLATTGRGYRAAAAAGPAFFGSVSQVVDQFAGRTTEVHEEVPA